SNVKGGLPIGITTNLTLASTIFLAPRIAEYEEPTPNYIDYDSRGNADQATSKNEDAKQKSILKRKLAEKNETRSELEAEVDELGAKLERLEAIFDSDSIGDVYSGKGEAESNKIIEAEATAYTAYCDTGCIGVTATGIDVSQSIYHEGKRVIAVDPSIIPLGSVVKVSLKNGELFEAVAIDTGGDINGARIDVLMVSKEEAIEFGRQAVE